MLHDFASTFKERLIGRLAIGRVFTDEPETEPVEPEIDEEETP